MSDEDRGSGEFTAATLFINDQLPGEIDEDPPQDPALVDVNSLAFRTKNRALEEIQKVHVMHEILKVWLANPQQRLGQLISNVLPNENPDPYYIEDYDLLTKIQVKFGKSKC